MQEMHPTVTSVEGEPQPVCLPDAAQQAKGGCLFYFNEI